MSGDDVSLIRWGNTTLLPSMDRTATTILPPQSVADLRKLARGRMARGLLRRARAVDRLGHRRATHQAMATRNGHEVVDPSQIPQVDGYSSMS